MSNRSDGDTRRPRIVDEDDWFATPAVEPDDPPGEVTWQTELETEAEPPRRPDDTLRRRQAVVVLAALVAVALGAAGILLARSIGGSDDTPGTTDVGTATQFSTAQVTTAPTTSTPTTSTSTPTTTSPGSSTTPSATAVPTDATLRAGSTGEAVTALQEALASLGYTVGTADGKYGPATTKAVTAFQESNDLKADGIAGPETIAAINEAVANA